MSQGDIQPIAVLVEIRDLLRQLVVKQVPSAPVEPVDSTIALFASPAPSVPAATPSHLRDLTPEGQSISQDMVKQQRIAWLGRIQEPLARSLFTGEHRDYHCLFPNCPGESRKAALGSAFRVLGHWDLPKKQGGSGYGGIIGHIGQQHGHVSGKSASEAGRAIRSAAYNGR